MNKDTQADDNGDIVIKYTNATKGLTIETSKPQITGILEIRHSKEITENNYSIFFKYLNNYNNNLFVCDFENMDYFWLCKLYNKKSSVELVK